MNIGIFLPRIARRIAGYRFKYFAAPCNHLAMKHKPFLILFIFCVLVSANIVSPLGAQAYQPYARLQVDTDPNSLIAAVNDLRASRGLPAYKVNALLMSITQAHAQYMASIGSVTHYSADGSRPFQRALAAGYPVAGDLSLGGFYSENIIAGSNMSVQEAVQAWKGDDPHLNTMVSPNLVEVGAGSVDVGGYIYYVLDAARPSGTVPTYIPPASQATSEGTGEAGGVPTQQATVMTIVPNTPLANGSIVHIVQPGETLWLIAISYGVKVDDLLNLNRLLPGSAIYPGDKIIIRLASTPLPSTSTPSRTPFPSATLVPTFTLVPTITLTPVPKREAPVSPTVSTTVAMGIVLAALVAAGVLAMSTRSSRR
jgi:uncharacterized protein YkwD